MFKNHYYHRVTKTAVTVFGSLFNNLTVVRYDGSGNTLNQIKVPLAYGPKQKFLARIDQKNQTDASLAIKMPRMSFEITSIAYDTGSKLSKYSTITESVDDPLKKNVIRHVAPYAITMDLNILAKNQDDALQILEQILPSFTPEYTLTIKPLKDFPSYIQDVPITLSSVSFADEYEGDFTQRRSIVYTLSFEMKLRYFGPKGDQSVIREANVDLNDLETSNLFEGIDLTITPEDATEDDFEVDVNIR